MSPEEFGRLKKQLKKMEMKNKFEQFNQLNRKSQNVNVVAQSAVSNINRKLNQYHSNINIKDNIF